MGGGTGGGVGGKGRGGGGRGEEEGGGGGGGRKRTAIAAAALAEGSPHFVRAVASAQERKRKVLSQAESIALSGAIVPLVSMLLGGLGPEAQEEAAGAMWALADFKSNRVAITEGGGIGPLVSLLACDNPRAREHAEGALVRLSIETANRVLIIKQMVGMLFDSGEVPKHPNGDRATVEEKAEVERAQAERVLMRQEQVGFLSLTPTPSWYLHPHP